MAATGWGIESSGFGYKIQLASKFWERKGIWLSCSQIHQTHAPPRRTAIHSAAARLLGFMISAPSTIKLKEFVVLLRRFLLSRGDSQIARLFGRRHRLRVSAGLGVSCRQCSN